ncbi:unnamed protein product [Schistosoma curassoni]|uniref:Abhydrolase_2 domain-containing protein n=1 Tax=Schistosoma curassoni TaxID=6186 RepID=A0A183JXR7_9TREM|nr:unnamed protein product [Schistosoma curassoni]
MEPLVNRCTWVHVDVPGQGDGESDLPAELQYVVVFGEGAGANILVRLVMLRYDIVLGAILIHCTGTTAGLSESLRDRLIGWKLNTVGMNPAAESYLLMHRFGSAADSENEIEVREVLIKFRQSLRTAINPRNLNKFIMSFMSNPNSISSFMRVFIYSLLILGTVIDQSLSASSWIHLTEKLCYSFFQAKLNNVEKWNSGTGFYSHYKHQDVDADAFS